MLPDSELLGILKRERERSIGFDYDDGLNLSRERAMQYAKGEMPDLKTLPNRSKVVSTDVADAVETVLPDLVEVFTGGEDVLSFVPRGAEDEEAAQQETDYLQYILFSKNDAWWQLYQAFKDALLLKVGVWKFWWDDAEEYDEESFKNKTADELALMQSMPDIEIVDIEEEEVELPEDYELPEGMEAPVQYSFKARKIYSKGCPRIAAVPPEDFTVGPDTVRLKEASYCAMRSRVRAQDLLDQGYDEDVVSQLSTVDPRREELVDQARDTANESDSSSSGTDYRLRFVEIIEHNLRIDADGDGKTEIWRIVTGGDEQVLLEKHKVDCIQFAAVTPFPVAHRFYGLSLADKLLEVQRIKTTLVRMLLDSGYFAINQRYEVSEAAQSVHTLDDLMRNEPGMPVRSKNGQAVRPIPPASLGFDPYMALEYTSTMAEMRTGVVRNAQGLNPDTLHDTAKGAMALMSMAQKRVRMIARIFAETGVKDLYLGVHGLVRQYAQMADKVRLRGSWVPIDPTKWGNRKDMMVEVGVGAGGREVRLASMQLIIQRLQTLAEAGGDYATMAPPEMVYTALIREAEAAGIRAPERFYAEPQELPPEGDPEIDAEMAKEQAKMQLEQTKLQAKAELEREKAELKAEVDLIKKEVDARLREDQMNMEYQLAQMKLQFDLVLKSMGAPGSVRSFNPGGAINR